MKKGYNKEKEHRENLTTKKLRKFQGANMANKAWKTLRVGKTKEQHFSLLSNF